MNHSSFEFCSFFQALIQLIHCPPFKKCGQLISGYLEVVDFLDVLESFEIMLSPIDGNLFD